MKAQTTINMNLKDILMCVVLSFFIVLNPLYKTINISYLIIGLLCVSLCFINSTRYSITENILLYISFVVALLLVFVNQYTDVLGISLLLFFSISIHKRISANLLLLVLIPIISILILKSVLFLQIEGISKLNGFYVNTSILIICLSVLKMDKINLAMLIILIVFTILFFIIKSRLGFIATCSLLLFKIFDHFKRTRLKVLSVLIFLSVLIPLLTIKKISITGRMHINTFILNHLDTVKFFDYNPFTNWYNHTIINHNVSEMSQIIGEVYNVAFNDYLQILIQYGIIPFSIFVALNMYILYILLKRKKGLYIVCFLIINLMLLTSYPFFMTASLFFLILFYVEIAKKEKLFKLNIFNKNTLFTNTISIKVITILLFFTLSAVYYYPKFVLLKNIDNCVSVNTLLDSKLTQHAFKNNEIKYWVAKEYISKDSKNAKRILLYLNDKNLSYNMLLFTGEVFEYLGEYEEAFKYYEKSHIVRPFTLLPIYKQLLINDHLKKKHKVNELLNFYRNMELRVDNDHTDVMKKEINGIIKKYKF
ncbi:hypothetical protein H2O64_17545 [Kordia sp. YSTF-M3]|uniref:O-antigen ligase n=1 Tax=Kordia aestuariivivens TaxID=2759037 RepID=A0ABR7QD30_9FLAO|nr:hypothetical protein [Kordia aestuariivivens]MBC8756482.1 hypothetical protein [Kordia aestuariivivens]